MSLQTGALPLPDPDKTYRVAAWSAGRVSTSAMRAVVNHPSMELVGLWVYSESKEGKDAGELCGLKPIGVKATRNIDEIIALKPDCVLYMQEGCNIDDVCKILSAGINIVTTRGEFHSPPIMDPEMRRRAEAACREGGAAIHSTGVSPGFITEAVPLVLTSLARRLDCLTIDEFADMPASCSDEMLLDVLGYGGSPDEAADPNLVRHITQSFGQSINVVAEAIAMPFDKLETFAETAVSKKAIPLRGGGVIEKGTVAARRFTVAGMRNGKPVLRFRANWLCTTDLDNDWETRENGWRILVEGDTPLDIMIGLPVERSEPEYHLIMAGYTAHRAVNAIPYVCAAEPGIRTSAELPQITARLD